MRKRYFASRPKDLPKGYDSKLEHRLHTTALSSCQHHPDKQDLIKYSIPHTYEYDFMFEYEDKLYLIETKGRFRDSTEASKYKHINDHLRQWDLFKESPCKDIELVFIFEKASTPFPFAKKRKDGTKMTHGEWASKNGFRWLCDKRSDLQGVVSEKDLVEVFNEKG